MDFNEIKDFVENNRETIDLLTPTFRLAGVVVEMLRRIDNAIKAPENEEPEPLTEDLRRDVNCSLDQVLEAMIGIEYTDKEKKLLDYMVLIYSNFNELYPGCIDRSFKIRLISILLSTERSLEDSIRLNSYLFGKVRSWFTEEGATTQLSKKYYTEYMHFLEGKKHNDDYSVRCS